MIVYVPLLVAASRDAFVAICSFLWLKGFTSFLIALIRMPRGRFLWCFPATLVMLLWLHARAEHSVSGSRASPYGPPDAPYCSLVRRQLQSIGRVPLEPIGGGWKVVRDSLNTYQDKALGLVLCRATVAPDMLTILSGSQRAVMDFRGETLWNDSPLVFFEVIEAATLVDPTQVFEAYIRDGKTSLFFGVTNASVERLNNTLCTNGSAKTANHS